MRAFLLVTDDSVIIRGYAEYDQAKPAMFAENSQRVKESPVHTVHMRAVDIEMDNHELIEETYHKYANHQLGVKDPYLIKVLFALIGLPEQCPACRCYDLVKTSDGQWCCANCKRTMIDCLQERLIK